MSAQFFTEEDFIKELDQKPMYFPQAWTELTKFTNKKLNLDGIKGFSQQHRGEWSFTERPMTGDTHNALLLNLGAIEPCAHEKYKVRSRFSGELDSWEIVHQCECGAEVEPAGFVEKLK